MPVVLSNFIRRGKRKGGNFKAIEPFSHQKSLSAPDASRVSLPLVLNINETVQPSPVVELNLSNPHEEWFPKELLKHKSCSQESPPLGPAQDATVPQSKLAQEILSRPSPVPSEMSLSQSETAPSVVGFRKKSIPAPIIIPDVDRVFSKVQRGKATAPTPPEPSQPIANNTPPVSPSPSVSDNLSSVSGTTLARALIGSSFVLSSVERHGSRHRTGITRQDSATLPRGSFFLSDSSSSSSIPPVPPVPTMLASISPDLDYPAAIRSGASTASEYPTSDSYTTSSEVANSSGASRRISRIQEIPSPIVPTPTNTPSALSGMEMQRIADPVLASTRVPRNGTFDVPKTAREFSLPESVLLSSDDHTLDEFDFLPPGSDSSSSYVPPIAPPQKRSNTNRRQWKRRAVGLNMVIEDSQDISLSDDAFASRPAGGLPSSTSSEHDYGELFNYDLTVSPCSNGSSSSASAGYQTFPETPVVLSPLWSTGYGFVSKSDSVVRRKRMSSLKIAGRGAGKFHSHMRSMRRQASNNGGGAVILRRAQSSQLPRQKTPPPDQAELVLPPSLPVDDGEGETGQPSTTDKPESQRSEEVVSIDRPHPLAHISSSSSYVLEEEGLRALAQYSPSFLPSIIVGDAGPLFDPEAVPVSDADPLAKSPTLVQLPDSVDVSPSGSPALGGSSNAISSAASPLQSPLSMTSTAISFSYPSKSLLSPPSPPPGESSFLPSPPTSSDEPLPPSHSPVAAMHIASDDLVPHSPSPSFVPPPPYHAVVSERLANHSSFIPIPSISRRPSIDPGLTHSRQASNSSLTSGSVRSRARPRPPLPFGPRKPSTPGQVFGSVLPGIRGRNGSTSSIGSIDPSGSPGFSWTKLHSAASKPPPKFQAPPPKWRGLTLEAAQWTFTSAQLQEIVSKAIQQSSEGSSLRFLRPEVLEGEITDEMHRLELQHVDAKAQYKALTRKRWILMGALAGHVEGVEMGDIASPARTVEELAEVLSALDGLTEKMHDTALQIAQLTSLREIHNTSALALAVRKINGVFVRQMAEKERMQDQVDTLRTERDEAWKHAEDIAQDYDTLNDRVLESAFGHTDAKAPDGDMSSVASSKRSTRISAVRKSSSRVSQAGLRSRLKQRPGRSSSNATRPASLALDDVPPVPRLPMTSPSVAPHPTGLSFGSVYCSTPGTSATQALAEAQREVYEMLGLSVPPSQASSRRRTLSGSDVLSLSSLPRSRPASESLDQRARARSHQELGRATRSVILDDRPSHHRIL